MGKHYTDKERFEVVKHFLSSNLSQMDYSRKYGYARTTLRDWLSAYNHISGDFIRIDHIGTDESIVAGKDIKMNLLRSEEIIKKSTHFTRFDHSIVVIGLGLHKLIELPNAHSMKHFIQFNTQL